MHRYELTLGDVTLLVLTILSVRYSKGMRKSFFPFFAILLLLITACLASSVMVRDWTGYFLSMIPFLFSVLISYATLNFFSSGDTLNRFRVFRLVLILSLALSAIPVYLQFFTGYKNVLFYDPHGWRYTFLAQNPNQYGVYFIIFFYLLTLITIKFFPKDLGKLILFQLAFFIPALFSGSKSTTLVFAANVAVLIFFYLWRSSIYRKVWITGLVSFFFLLFFNSFITTVKESAGQVNRALTIFDKVADIENFEIGGGTGRSINHANLLFKQYPLLGVGLGNKPVYTNSGVEIHNTFLLFLAETGIIGFTAFMFMFLLPVIYAMFSRSSIQFKLLVLIIFALFAAQNVPGMLFRQRWVWLFMCISFILVNVDEKGKFQKSRLTLLH